MTQSDHSLIQLVVSHKRERKIVILELTAKLTTLQLTVLESVLNDITKSQHKLPLQITQPLYIGTSL